MEIAKLKEAHKFSINNKPELQKDKICGCFHCLAVFDPKEITDWIKDEKGTAKCPFCGIDSVIGEYSGFPITIEFLAEMKKHWFRVYIKESPTD